MHAAESDTQFWPVLSLNHALGDRWGAHLTFRTIFDDDVSQTNRLLARGFVTWKAHDAITLGLGYDYHYSLDSRSEHRPWQQVQHRLRWRDLTLRNRMRLDNRFVEGVGGVVVRLRYRLRATHPIGGSEWNLVLSDEVFTNLNNRGEGPVSGFDQNRLRAAVGTRLFRHLRVESGYEWHYVARRDGPAQSRHVLVLQFSIDTGSRP